MFMYKSNKKKAIISLVLVFVIILSSLMTSCKDTSSENVDIEAEIKRKVNAYRTDLLDSSETLLTNYDVSKYLLAWGQSKNIDTTLDSNENVIMNVPADEDSKDSHPILIIATFDVLTFESSSLPLAAGLYFAKNPQSSGPTTVIFTPKNSGTQNLMSSLDLNLLSADTRIFCLSDAETPLWSLNSGFQNKFEFENAVEYTQPKGFIAYELSISGLISSTPDSNISQYPNPIKEFSNLLAYFKANAIIFELASFNGGLSPYVYPNDASMTIVFSEDYKHKITSKIDKVIEDWNDRYSDEYPDAEFEYHEIEIPEAVLTKSSLDAFINSIYTLFYGVYYKNTDESIESITNIGQLTLNESKYIITGISNSVDSETLNEIKSDYEIIASLSNISFVMTPEKSGWEFMPDETSTFEEDLIKAFKDYSGDNLTFKDCVQSTPATEISKINPSCQVVNILFREDKLEKYTGCIATYIRNIHAEPEDEE